MVCDLTTEAHLGINMKGKSADNIILLRVFIQ